MSDQAGSAGENQQAEEDPSQEEISTPGRSMLVECLIDLGSTVSEIARELILKLSYEELSTVVRHDTADVIFRIDEAVEEYITDYLHMLGKSLGGIVLIGEGFKTSGEVFPEGLSPEKAAMRILLDPIDGSRGLMFDKRSAFFIAAVAPNMGPETRLSDTFTAVMVEIPTTRALYQDVFWVERGESVGSFTRNLFSRVTTPCRLGPSPATELRGSFAQICRFFHPNKALIATLEEELIHRLYPDAPEEETIVFDDQFASSAGQIYEMMKGRDRFVADLRHCFNRQAREEGRRTSHVCHPYDCAGHLIGSEAGLLITGPRGEPFDAPMDTSSPVDWIGYSNEHIRAQVEPVLMELLAEKNL